MTPMSNQVRKTTVKFHASDEEDTGDELEDGNARGNDPFVNAGEAPARAFQWSKEPLDDDAQFFDPIGLRTNPELSADRPVLSDAAESSEIGAQSLQMGKRDQSMEDVNDAAAVKRKVMVNMDDVDVDFQVLRQVTPSLKVDSRGPSRQSTADRPTAPQHQIVQAPQAGVVHRSPKLKPMAAPEIQSCYFSQEEEATERARKARELAAPVRILDIEDVSLMTEICRVCPAGGDGRGVVEYRPKKARVGREPRRPSQDDRSSTKLKNSRRTSDSGATNSGRRQPKVVLNALHDQGLLEDRPHRLLSEGSTAAVRKGRRAFSDMTLGQAEACGGSCADIPKGGHAPNLFEARSSCAMCPGGDHGCAGCGHGLKVVTRNTFLDIAYEDEDENQQGEGSWRRSRSV